jgi:hypothetical protein
MQMTEYTSHLMPFALIPVQITGKSSGFACGEYLIRPNFTFLFKNYIDNSKNINSDCARFIKLLLFPNHDFG